jgi:hypothetical protein
MTPDMLFKNGKFVLGTEGSDGVSAESSNLKSTS